MEGVLAVADRREEELCGGAVAGNRLGGNLHIRADAAVDRGKLSCLKIGHDAEGAVGVCNKIEAPVCVYVSFPQVQRRTRAIVKIQIAVRIQVADAVVALQTAVIDMLNDPLLRVIVSVAGVEAEETAVCSAVIPNIQNIVGVQRGGDFIYAVHQQGDKRPLLRIPPVGVP